MKKTNTYLFVCLLILANTVYAQIDKAAFMTHFNKADVPTKVRLLADLPYSDVESVYPLIKDTLEKIKEEVFQTPNESNEDLKFQFQKLDAKKEIYLHHHKQALFLLDDALRHSASNIDDTLACIAMLKDVFVKIKNVNRALEMHYLLENKWKRKSKDAIIDYGAKKSHLLFLLGMNKEAIDESRKEFNERPNKNDTNEIIHFHNELGTIYNYEKNGDSAAANLLKAKYYLKHISKAKDSLIDYEFYKGLVDGNLGLSYFLKGNIKEALPLLQHDIQMSMKSHNYQSAFNAYHVLIKCYIQLKNKNLAKDYIDTAQFLLKDKIKDVNVTFKFLPTLADYYTLTGNYKLIAETYKEYFRLNDSLTNNEKEINRINQDLTFNIDQRDLAYAEQDKRIKEQQLEEAREKNFRVSVLSGLLILLIIILFLSVNNRRIKMREKQLSLKNEQIQQQNNQIEHTLKEKEALIKEIHHRVKNNLQIITSMLNLQAGRINDEKTENIFLEAKQRINAIALTHQMLYQKSTISEVNLRDYIEALVRQIEASMSAPNVLLRTELFTSKETLTIDGAVPLGLIINELLTNAYKHAFPINKSGDIIVSLINQEHSLLIKVSDNGIGLPPNFEPKENISLGMELVLILVEQLDSQLIVESNNGSTFMFEIKKNNSERS